MSESLSDNWWRGIKGFDANYYYCAALCEEKLHIFSISTTERGLILCSAAQRHFATLIYCAENVKKFCLLCKCTANKNLTENGNKTLRSSSGSFYYKLVETLA